MITKEQAEEKVLEAEVGTVFSFARFSVNGIAVSMSPYHSFPRSYFKNRPTYEVRLEIHMKAEDKEKPIGNAKIEVPLKEVKVIELAIRASLEANETPLSILRTLRKRN